MMHYVLDSWPVLAWIKHHEPASSSLRSFVAFVAEQDDTLAMSLMNCGEVVYMVRKSPDILDPQGALQRFYSLPIVFHSVDDALVSEAVDLKSVYPISFADAFAAALAIRLRVPLVTGDQELLTLKADGVLQLHWLGA